MTYFGAVVESDKPGVVFDTLGLNGARMVTALAWDETSFRAELAHRVPDVVAIAYGTNESQDFGASRPSATASSSAS